MKKFILNFKQTVRFTVSVIISREFAFVYCVLGTVSQIAHCYFLLESISSLTGNWKIFQATILSIFISSSLLYFVAIADNSDESEKGVKEYKKVILAINLFTIIEIIINSYYYSRHLIIDVENYKIFDFVFALIVSCLIPITIKLYSSSIRAKEWIINIEHDKTAFVSQDLNQSENEEKSNNISELTQENLLAIIQPMITEFENSLKDIQDINQDKIDTLINEKLKTLNTDIDTQIGDSFKKNQDLFLKQFENRVKIVSNEYLSKITTQTT